MDWTEEEHPRDANGRFSAGAALMNVARMHRGHAGFATNGAEYREAHLEEAHVHSPNNDGKPVGSFGKADDAAHARSLERAHEVARDAHMKAAVSYNSVVREPGVDSALKAKAKTNERQHRVQSELHAEGMRAARGTAEKHEAHPDFPAQRAAKDSYQAQSSKELHEKLAAKSSAAWRERTRGRTESAADEKSQTAAEHDAKFKKDPSYVNAWHSYDAHVEAMRMQGVAGNEAKKSFHQEKVNHFYDVKHELHGPWRAKKDADDRAAAKAKDDAKTAKKAEARAARQAAKPPKGSLKKWAEGK